MRILANGNVGIGTTSPSAQLEVNGDIVARTGYWSHLSKSPTGYTSGGDKDFFIEFPEGYRSHQIRLEGGDCSTDSFCYPSV